MKITAKISPFSDRIEHIQVDDGFKKKYSDYLPEDAGGIKRNLRVKGTIAYTSRIGKWSSRLKLSIKADKIPEGLRISLKKQPREEASYLPGETMMLKSNNDFVFYVNVSKEYAEGSYEESKTVSFHVTLELNERRLFGLLKSDLVHHQIPYTFEVGPDLGTTWIAIDPGTTGTTIAMSDGIHNLVIPRKNNNYLITPSVVAFNKEFEMKNPDFPLSGRGSLYRTGEGAEQWMGTDTGTRKGEYFESIKKMLGYSNSQLVSFDNGHELPLTGKELTSLLMEEAYETLNAYLDDKNLRAKFSDGAVPKRAIVAIPNNFTPSRIKDMVSAMQIFNQAKSLGLSEIRYIYEAEAVLFHYLSKADESQFQSREHVMVFDMGGATINATFIQLIREEDAKSVRFHSDILGKQGYNIGGDTIDYCLLKAIYKNATEDAFIKKETIDPFKNEDYRLKRIYRDFVREIKHQIVAYDLKGGEFISEIGFINTTQTLVNRLNEYLKSQGRQELQVDDYPRQLGAFLRLLKLADYYDLKELEIARQVDELEEAIRNQRKQLNEIDTRISNIQRRIKENEKFLEKAKDDSDKEKFREVIARSKENIQGYKRRVITINEEIKKFLGSKEDYLKELENIRKLKGSPHLFETEPFQSTIYQNIEEIVNELLSVVRTKSVNKIIFSGRSTLFPGVKETVIRSLSSVIEGEILSVDFDLSESKIAVVSGAAHYATAQAKYSISNTRTHASYGVNDLNKSLTGEFVRLIRQGATYKKGTNGVLVKSKAIPYSTKLQKLEFFQVFGAIAKNDIRDATFRHKVNKLGEIRLSQPSEEIGIKVFEDDNLEYWVMEEGSIDPKIGKTEVSGLDLEIENDEHFSFFVNYKK